MSKKSKEDHNPTILRIACGLCGVVMNNQTADLILEVVAAMKKKGDQFNVHDAVDIEMRIERRYKQKIVTAEPAKQV